jgi:hypothetical protein
MKVVRFVEDCDRGNALLLSVKTEAIFPCAHAAAVQRSSAAGQISSADQTRDILALLVNANLLY